MKDKVYKPDEILCKKEKKYIFKFSIYNTYICKRVDNTGIFLVKHNIIYHELKLNKRRYFFY